MESEQENNYVKDLYKIRILDKNLAYIIGLPQHISKAHVLKKHCFLGQYGKLQNISINTNKPFNSGNTPVPSFSGHVTYKSDFSVALVILALDHFSYKEFKIKASFGLTKYCKYYILNQKCKNFNCQYKHELAEDDEIAQEKQDMQTKRSSILTYLINHNQICQFLDQKFPVEQTEFPSLNYLQKQIFKFVQKKLQQGSLPIQDPLIQQRVIIQYSYYKHINQNSQNFQNFNQQYLIYQNTNTGNVNDNFNHQFNSNQYIQNDQQNYSKYIKSDQNFDRFQQKQISYKDKKQKKKNVSNQSIQQKSQYNLFQLNIFKPQF